MKISDLFKRSKTKKISTPKEPIADKKVKKTDLSPEHHHFMTYLNSGLKDFAGYAEFVDRFERLDSLNVTDEERIHIVSTPITKESKLCTVCQKSRSFHYCVFLAPYSDDKDICFNYTRPIKAELINNLKSLEPDIYVREEVKHIELYVGEKYKAPDIFAWSTDTPVRDLGANIINIYSDVTTGASGLYKDIYIVVDYEHGTRSVLVIDVVVSNVRDI